MDCPESRRRWYLPTPAWLVYGATVATCVLYASEQFPWRSIGLNDHKGWSVLLAAAVVGVILILLPAWMLAALLVRRRVQFGLPTVLVFVALCAVACSWLGVRIKQSRRQGELVGRIKKITGVNVQYTFEFNLSTHQFDRGPPAPELLIKLLGVDFFGDVEGLRGRDDFKSHHPNRLDPYCPQYTDAELLDVAALTRLKYLSIGGDQIIDAGLSQLETLTNLQVF